VSSRCSVWHYSIRAVSESEKKKLIRAGEYWAKGDANDSQAELEEDAQLFGLELPNIEPVKDYEVWADAEESLILFLSCSTQWRYSFSGVIGLDYNVVISLMAIHGIKDSHKRQVMSDIGALESGALNVFNRSKN